MSKLCPVSAAHKLSPPYDWLRYMIIVKTTFTVWPRIGQISTMFIADLIPLRISLSLNQKPKYAFTKTLFLSLRYDIWCTFRGFCACLFYGISQEKEFKWPSIKHFDYRWAVRLPFCFASWYQISGWLLLAWRGKRRLMHGNLEQPLLLVLSSLE